MPAPQGSYPYATAKRETSTREEATIGVACRAAVALAGEVLRHGAVGVYEFVQAPQVREREIMSLSRGALIVMQGQICKIWDFKIGKFSFFAECLDIVARAG